MYTHDFVVIGAGVIGVQIALHLKKKYPEASIAVLEKEEMAGFHSSGRNSGVLHAGFYYTSDSLKAKFTREGNVALTDYCDTRGLQINKCGKLVVAKDESDLSGLQTLFDRGKANGVPIEEVDEEGAKKLEPRAKTYKRALYSPSTSSVDPKEVLNSFIDDAQKEGIEFFFNTKYLSRKGNQVISSSGGFSFGTMVNAAGLYADTIARDFGCSKDFRIIPFKGLYLYGNQGAGKYEKHIYPVPNLKNPFLGVHSTLTVDGKFKIGPTAIPAFWRENYTGFDRFNLGEFFTILKDELGLFYSNSFNFRSLAVTEMRKYNKSFLVDTAKALLPELDKKHFTQWGKPGMRAQLLNIRTRELVMDYVIEKGESSIHVLNAVSPAFTSSIPFANHVVGMI